MGDNIDDVVADADDVDAALKTGRSTQIHALAFSVAKT